MEKHKIISVESTQDDIYRAMKHLQNKLKNLKLTQTDMKKEIYKVGDTVYHYGLGRGEVTAKENDNRTFSVAVMFDGGHSEHFTETGRDARYHSEPVLSFTPYDLVNGGFSQERPLPNIEVDTLVYVRSGGNWEMRFFSHFGEDGVIRCFDWQQKSTETDSLMDWPEWSLTNPLEEK